jgi:signal transduction histidine kinase
VATDAQWTRRLQRMRARAEAAEAILESKSRELWESRTELERVLAELEHRVAERTAEVERARDEAQRANQVKSRFLANMSHELRTPLTAILGYGELLLEEAAPSMEPLHADDLQRVCSSAQHLLGLINDVLDLSKVEAGRVRVSQEPVPLRPLLEEVLTLVEPIAASGGNALVLHVDADLPPALADPQRLKQCALNLLSNAAKFTEGGRVTTSASLEGRSVVVRVEDTGVGLTAEQADRIFEPFEQVDDAHTRRHAGTGLGLALSRRLMEAMDGGLELEGSTPGVGSTFSLRVPAALG